MGIISCPHVFTDDWFITRKNFVSVGIQVDVPKLELYIQQEFHVGFLNGQFVRVKERLQSFKLDCELVRLEVDYEILDIDFEMVALQSLEEGLECVVEVDYDVVVEDGLQ
ncbi:hypothetical protein L2E82_30795 [Cichorium intybus]|uniref:Uncharacterized protein n=1 Tax=Cichorium intybus TaxID=13427 RepID=A0ACB9D240_CICIN|nr:hypothetical protein L2E82_30795 [Cichorium intybus]